MKIKIGTITEEIVRMNNEIYKSVENGNERLSIELKDTSHTVEGIDGLIAKNFDGSLTFIDDGKKEEAFNGYTFESVRKSYDTMGKQLTMEFKKAGQEESGENA